MNTEVAKQQINAQHNTNFGFEGKPIRDEDHRYERRQPQAKHILDCKIIEKGKHYVLLCNKTEL